MKGMQKIKRGTGFKGVLQYALENGRGVVIGGNLSADAPQIMQQEFLTARALRPDIEKAVWHNSLRLPPDEKIGAEKWARIADEYMQRMGFSELHQRTYILHDDAEGQHIHIIANRIALDGKVYLGQNENLESTRIIADLERTYDLTITKSRDYENDGLKKAPTKDEIEMSIRTGEAPPKLKIQTAIDAALEAGVELPQFIERVESAGITVTLNLASTGRISGISFELDSIAFKGSSLGKQYSYSNLEKRGLIYDIEQHRETAQTHSQNRGLYNEQVSNSERNEYVERNRDDIEYQSAASADTETRTSAGTIGAEHRAPGASAGSVERRDESFATVAEKRDRETDSRKQGSIRSERKNDSFVISKDAKDMAVYAERRTYDYSQDADSMRSYNIYHNGGAYSRIADLFKSAAVNSRTSSLRDVSGDARDTTAAAKRHAIALGVKEVLIGIRDSIGGMMMHKTYLVEKFEKVIPWLKRMNARGNDVYIRPGEADTGILLVDDLNKANLDRLQKDIGTVAVTETSPGNFQAWCRLADTLDIDTRREAARVIAKRYDADMNSADGQHYGRLAGFTNRKPEHQRNGLSPFVIEHKPSPGRESERVKVLTEARQRIAAAEIERAAQLRRDNIARTDNVYRADPAHLYRRAAKTSFERYGESADVSKIDYYAAKMLAIDGYSAKTIAQTIIDCSPDIEQRKAGHVADYAARTAEAASKDPAVLQAKREEQKRSYGMAR